MSIFGALTVKDFLAEIGIDEDEDCTSVDMLPGLGSCRHLLTLNGQE